MLITQPLLRGRLVRRYKRFLADVELEDGSLMTVHCPNPGRMIGCSTPGSAVVLRDSQNPKRKLVHTLQTVEEAGTLINVDTSLPNACVEEAILAGQISELAGYESLRREVGYGASSRIDILLEDPTRGRCYVEVKSATLAQGSVALFPDAVSARALKHLDELIEMVQQGHRAVIFFFVSRGDVTSFAPADDIDPAYATKLREAVVRGVEALAWTSDVQPASLSLLEPIAVDVESRIALDRTQ